MGAMTLETSPQPSQSWVLETERLRLRRLLPGDLADLYALYRDPEIRRYFPEGVLSYEDTEAELTYFLHGHPKNPDLGLWATILKETGAFIGRCGLLPWTLEGLPEVEVAFLLDKAYWGRGLATEAAEAIATYAFETLELTRLVCLIDEENTASQRVAERIGMTFERAMEDELGPFWLYSLDKRSQGTEG